MDLLTRRVVFQEESVQVGIDLVTPCSKIGDAEHQSITADLIRRILIDQLQGRLGISFDHVCPSRVISVRVRLDRAGSDDLPEFIALLRVSVPNRLQTLGPTRLLSL